MKNLLVMETALSFIEQNLENDFTQNDVADACYVSLSGLQKLFRFAFHYSVGEYISKRRMTCAAKALCETDTSILEVALRYGYHSPEVFTRAFVRVWQEKPSEFRKTRRFYGICPPLCPNTNGGTHMSRLFDISELYDYLQENCGSYALCFDICGLLPINENIGREAGDLAITESMRRIDAVCGDGMLAFRIGGDEFVLVTATTDYARAQALLDTVLAENGKPVSFRGQEIPISLHGAMTTLRPRAEGAHSIAYQQMYSQFQEAINLARK